METLNEQQIKEYLKDNFSKVVEWCLNNDKDTIQFVEERAENIINNCDDLQTLKSIKRDIEKIK